MFYCEFVIFTLTTKNYFQILKPMKRIIFFLLCFCASVSFAQYNYPATKTADSTNTYFGVTYHDPYRWLEYMKDTSVVSWFHRQADFSNTLLNKINGRDELIAEWKMLDKLQPASITGIIYENGRLFYKKTTPGEKVGKLYYRQGENGEEILLFDPLTFISGKTLTIEDYTPSFDGRMVAIAYSQKGAEVSTLKVIDVDSRQLLKDEIYPCRGTESWSLDNKSVLYMSLKTADNTDPKARLNTKTKLHILGQDTSKDVDFFSTASYPDLHLQAKAYPYIFVDEDNPNYIFAIESSVQREFTRYYAPMSQFNSGHIDWKVLCKPSDKLVRMMLVVNGTVYSGTYDQAKNYKVVSTPISNPDWKNAKVIIPEKNDESLQTFIRTKDYLLLSYSNGITDHLYRYNLNTGQTDQLKLPISGNLTIFRLNCFNNKTNTCLVSLVSNIKPTTEFELDAATGLFSPGKFNKPATYPEAYTHLIEKNVEVKGHDGVMIPLTILYREGTKLDGKNVCLMDSYGAYGISMSPYFFVYEVSLAVKGVVIALPHVRGGSEKGQAWYMAGYKTTKPNTWKDFNSCAEYLIHEGYTEPSRLSGWGTSAGGILISRAITERPDLYAAAICNVGCANAMRLEFSSNGPVNIPEFGTVKDSVECKALYEMDGMQHVVKGIKYPALICIGGWNDPRVVPWEPAKFAAALQNASSSGKPAIMKVNYDNGHFTEDKSVEFANFADQLAFAMWQCGHPDFQLKKQQ
jgi:prolyl oligopeptidase